MTTHFETLHSFLTSEVFFYHVLIGYFEFSKLFFLFFVHASSFLIDFKVIFIYSGLNSSYFYKFLLPFNFMGMVVQIKFSFNHIKFFIISSFLF